MSEFDLEGANIAPVPEREAVSPETFQTEIRAARQPVVMRGLAKDWPVCAAANASPDVLGSYLKGVAGPQTVEVKLSAPEVAGRYFYSDDMSRAAFGRQQAPIPGLIDQLLGQQREEKPMGIYVDAASARENFPGFEAQNPMPFVPDDAPPRLWIGNSARVAPHFDLGENLACVAGGARRFLLFPPEQVANLYVGPLDYTLSGVPVSMVDPRHPDLDAYPKYQEALSHAMFAELGPGDAIYIPSPWWHYIESSGPLNLLVNYWWNHPVVSPVTCLGLAAYALRRMPEQDRAAWKSFFEHYVFGADAPDAMAHLPEFTHGILARPSPEGDAKTRAYLRNDLMQSLSN